MGDNQPFDYGDGQIVSVGFWLPSWQEAMVRDIQRQIGEKDGLAYRFDTVGRRPWVRVYEGVFPKKNAAKVAEAIGKLMTPFVAMRLRWGEIEQTGEVVVLWGRQTEAATLLLEAVVNALAHLREGYVKQKYINQSWEPIEQESIDRWGWPWVEEYAPYVVIGRAKTTFDLRDFNVEWEEKWALLTRMFVAVKLQPGKLEPLLEMELKEGEGAAGP
jgi:hypothetical protein